MQSSVVATNIRTLRESSRWTQEELAREAGVTVRTVQRAEEGRVVSADTLQEIAAALGVSVEGLTTDPLEFLARRFGVDRSEVTPEWFQQRLEQFAENHRLVGVACVKGAAGWEPLFQASAAHVSYDGADERVLDQVALIKDAVRDVLDCGDDLGSIGQRQCAKMLWGVVESLRALRHFVYVGLDHATMILAGGGEWGCPTLYVVVAPDAQVVERIAIAKGARFGIG